MDASSSTLLPDTDELHAPRAQSEDSGMSRQVAMSSTDVSEPSLDMR